MSVNARYLWSSIRGGSVATMRYQDPALLGTDLNMADVKVEGWRKKRATITTKLLGLVQSFEQAIPSPSNRRTQDVHVGHLLSALKEMMAFMQASGMSTVAKSMAPNIVKMEELYHQAPAQQRDSLSDLLRYEVNLGVHARDPKGGLQMEDSSGAMGLLWLGRNLSYQQYMYQLMLEDGKEPFEAATIAFQRHLRPHLHWTVAKILQTAIRTLTPARKSSFFSLIGGFDEQCYGYDEDVATKKDLQDLADLFQPLLLRLRQVFSELFMEVP